MRRDDAGERPALQQARQQGVPELARRLVVDAGVDQREALAVLDQINVDMVEPERQRQPRPQDAVSDLDRLSRRRGMRETGD